MASSPLPPPIFFQGPVDRASDLFEVLDKISREVWEKHAASLRPTGSLLIDLNAYLTALVDVMPKFADRLARAEHVEDYVSNELARLNEESDFSDLKYMTPLSQQLQKLSENAGRIQSAFEAVRKQEEIDEERNRNRTTPIPEIVEDDELPRSDYLNRPVRDADAGLPPMEDEPETRGTGNYTCPLGHECQAGGVLPDGELVEFTRNSDFRSHLRKHSRPFKCSLPGCTNIKGFARLDQLHRHQQIAKHDA